MTDTGALLNLPRTKPINITFENISFSVPLPGREKGRKQILKCINGEFRSGELTAIMGPSGAGKSSFLNILTGFSSKGMQGCIYRNGLSFSEKGGNFRKESCYIMQDDLLSPLITVMEYMVTASQLKLGISFSHKSKMILIEDILDSLGLACVKDVRCERLSGGQRKRLSIALELLDNPSVMFLDEPTTGLDSSSTAQCVALLKALARGGRTIVCTIHQPSALVYEMFDLVYLLADGVNIYQGSSKNTVPFLLHVGLPCPQYHSVADYIAELAAGDHGDYSSMLSQHAADSRWRSPPPVIKHDDPLLKRNLIRARPPSEFTKVWILINRNLILLYRDWTVTHLKLLLHCLVGIILGLNFENSGSDGSKTIQNVGFIFSTIIYLSYTALMPAILRFPSEMSVVKKERFNNWYTLRTYYIAFLTTNTPIQLMFVSVFVTVSYYLTGQVWELERYAMYMSICMLTTLNAEGLGLYLGTFANIIHGLFFGSLFIAYLLVYSGCLALFPHMSPYLYSLSFLSFGRYAFEGLIQSVYGNGRPNLPCPRGVDYCHIRSPARLLLETGVHDGTFWIDFGVLLGMLLFLRTIAFISLHRKVTCR